MKATRYVIQNNKGEFYWKGEASSLYGFDKNFDKAFLFKSKQGAELRMRIFPNCTIMEVELKLIEMTQEEKELLIKDLCARLLYDPLVEYKDEEYNVLGITHGRLVLCKPFMSFTLKEHPLVEEVKPYLFPLSSMTEEQKEELKREISKQTEILIERMKNDDCGIDCGKYHFHSILELEWLLKNHFDFRGLIPMGLAIDATGLNIY